MSRVRAVVAAVVLVLVWSVSSPPASAASWDHQVHNAIYSWWGHNQSHMDVDGMWVGSIARLGTVRLHHIAHDGTQTELRLGRVPADDHTTPAVALHPDRADMLVFWTGHGQTDVVGMRRIDRTTKTMGPPVELVMPGLTTYTQVVTYGDRVVLVTRAGSNWVYTVSDDWGLTWDAPRHLFDNVTYSSRVYVSMKQHPTNPARAQLAAYGHPTIATPYRHADYAEVDLRTGAVAASFVADEPDPESGVIRATADGHYGNLLDDESGPALLPGTLPHAVSASGTYRIRMLDVGYIDGRPAISYAVWLGATGPARYKVKVLGQDGVWRNNAVSVPSGAVFGYRESTKYLGGTVFAQDDSVVLTRENAGRWYIERHRSDGTRERIGGGGTRPLARPYVPRGAEPGTFVVQKLLDYGAYNVYDSSLLVYGAPTPSD